MNWLIATDANRDAVTFWTKLDAVGSILAAVLAGVAGYVAYRLYKVESGRDQRTAAAQKSQQAAGVGVWLEDNRMTGSQFVLNAIVANYSNAPIYDVDLMVRPHRDVVVGDPNDPTIALGDEWHAIPPGGRQELDVTELMEDWQSERVPRIEVKFRDNANVRWMRSDTGLLTEAAATI